MDLWADVAARAGLGELGPGVAMREAGEAHYQFILFVLFRGSVDTMCFDSCGPDKCDALGSLRLPQHGSGARSRSWLLSWF